MNFYRTDKAYVYNNTFIGGKAEFWGALKTDYYNSAEVYNNHFFGIDSYDTEGGVTKI